MFGARLFGARVFWGRAGFMENKAQVVDVRSGCARAGFMKNKTRAPAGRKGVGRGRFCGTKLFGCASSAAARRALADRSRAGAERRESLPDINPLRIFRMKLPKALPTAQ